MSPDRSAPERGRGEGNRTQRVEHGARFRFAAFISYSHAADGRLAPALVSGLHRFAKPWYRLRALRVFHDETTLAATPGLWAAIERALSSSEFFILLASAEAARSHWVAQELEYWLDSRRPEELLLAQTDGEIVWDGAACDFDWAKTTALPHMLAGAFPDEPRYVDLRWARTVEDLSLHNPTFRSAVADLAAPLHHRDKDALVGEDVRQRRRTLRIAWTAVVVILALLVAAIIAGIIAVQQRNSARAAASRALAGQAFTTLNADPLLALRLAVEAGRSSLTPEAEAALRAVLGGPVPYAVLNGEAGPAGSGAFSDGGRRLVTASADGTSRIWDTATGRTVLVLRGHKGGVERANFSADGTRIVTAGADKTTRIWDARSGTVLHVLRGHNSFVSDAAFSRDGSRIVSASNDARIWNSTTGRQLKVLRGHDSYVNSAAFNRDGSRIATASDDGTVRIWNAVSGKQLRVLRGRRGSIPMSGVVFSRDGRRVLAATDDGTTLIWDADSGRIVETRRAQDVLVTGGAVGPDGRPVVAFTADGRLVVTVRDGVGRVWERHETTPLQVLRGHDGPLETAAFNPDGSRVVTAGGGRARMWDVARGKPLTVLHGLAYRASFTADGRRVLTSVPFHGTTMWDAVTGKRLRTGRDLPPVDGATRSSDGRIVIAFPGNAAEIRDVESRKTLHILRGHNGRVWSARFSPDGALVVTASEDGTARIWDSRSGTMLRVLRGHAGRVYSASFSPDGRDVVTAGADGTVRIWDTATGNILQVLRGRVGAVLSAAFNSDGSEIVAGAGNGIARIYRCGVCGPREQLLTRAGAVLDRPGVKREASSTTG